MQEDVTMGLNFVPWLSLSNFVGEMRKMVRIITKLVLILVGLSVLTVLVFRWVPVPVTSLMVIRNVNPPEGMEAGQGWKHEWVPLEQMSKWMPKAVVSSEDQRFYMHHGFDFDEIQKAMKEAQEGGRSRGASTISQQTAKNMFLWPAHSWVRKGLEAYFTVLIEVLWPKERILEVYLNSIEMGPGIYGVQAAAQHYFGKDAKDLSKSQCALIAAALPAPLDRNPAHPSRYMQKRKRRIMRYM